MAGIFITSKNIMNHSLHDFISGLSFTSNDWKYEYTSTVFQCVLTRVDRKDLWSPAIDIENKIFIGISGRIVLTPDQWQTGLSKSHRGGAAASYLIDEYLRKGIGLASNLNGAYTIFIIDENKEEAFLITDRLGFYPIFIYQNPHYITISTNFDSIAKFEGNLAYDLETMAEMLKFGYSVHPYTYYKQVKQLDPSSVYKLEKNKIERLLQYWKPEPNFEFNDKKLIFELSHSISDAVKLRTQKILGETGVFLSAGADSRVVLAASVDPSTIKSFTFYDVRNNEFNLASNIARAYGSEHIGLQREKEHYALGAEKASKIISALWNIQDAHYTNFIEKITSYNLDNLLSGCFADYLFKGIALNRSSIKLLGRPIPLYKTSAFNQKWYFAVSELKSNYDKISIDRNLSQYDGIDLTHDDETTKWMIEIARLYPISREATIGSRILLLRTLPWDPVLSDYNILQVYQKIPPSLKVNGFVWKKAVFELAEKVRHIVDNNNLSPLNANSFSITLHFLKGVLYRKVRHKDVDGTNLNDVVTRGSWPNFYVYLKRSEIFNKLWLRNRKITEDMFVEILGYNPYEWTTTDWADKDINLFFRMLTLKLWLEK